LSIKSIILRKVGQLDNAKKVKLFENDDWNNSDLREVLIQKVEQFLNSHAK
ncbi:hypothetical protein LCGC14_1973210, partial [marine sediment metagenome]